ncbi:hypothetical protein OKJ48_11015 [Streptomyces kunmingensis]|uniref:Aromatic ring-opening dioxygenase LigA n=1 Tax=Streptomyces kunmingensis TaxID=68225 RepID=A0ABU6C7S4_9ACTN|nr:hypothetical protein [Streptomyces kunmingensis]MEB3960768.1 hypothetical protein [Streptomyces kunmingensis]
MTPRTRGALRTVAIASCLPYLILKVVWIAGGTVGIPAGSSLLEHRATMAVANAFTVLLDSAVVVLALLLTRPWGQRVPAVPLAVPMWVATGLLLPIMAGYPVQLLVEALGGTAPAGSSDDPFLDPWVFMIVYPGFIVQGLCLGALFLGYARQRWGHLWQGRLGDLAPVGGAPRVAAVAAAVLALFPAATHLLWALGSETGLAAGRIADRASDFYVLEALNVLYPVAAVAGALLLAFPRGRSLTVKVPLAAAWLGSGAAACWGGWMLLATLAATGDAADRPTALMRLTYAGQMTVGLLVALVGIHYVRTAARPRRLPGVTAGAPVRV